MQLRSALIGLAFALLAGTVLAQGTAFEVASVKPNVGGLLAGAPPPHGTFQAHNASLQTLIERAYGVLPSQIGGGPSWMQTERFDINAKFEGDASLDDQALMLRQLLSERFRLQIRHESRELHVYSLERTHSDGSLGPKLVASTRDCSKEEPVSTQEAMQIWLTKQAPDCGKFFSWDHRIAGTATDLAAFMKVLNLAAGLDGPIVDNTGLTGKIDWDVSWTQDARAVTSDPFGISLLTAIQDQMGLRLRATRTLVDVVMVEHAERPTED